jgi:hypothetical protein
MKLFNLEIGTNPATLLLGAGAVLMAPVVVPVAGSAVKALTKAAIKAGLIFYQKGREGTAYTREVLEDLAAEAKHELSQKGKKGTSGKAAAKPSG